MILLPRTQADGLAGYCMEQGYASPYAEQGRQFQGVKSMVNKAPEAILYKVRYID